MKTKRKQNLLNKLKSIYYKYKLKKSSPIKRKQNSSKALIICMIIMISLFSVLMPMKTFASKTSLVEMGEDLNKSIVEELNQIDFSGFNDVIVDFQNNNSNIFSIENVKNKIYSIISGEEAINYSSFFTSIFSGIINLIINYLPVLSLIIAIGIISNLLNGIKSKFEEKSTSNLVHLVCFMAVVILMVGVITSISNKTEKSIGGMVKIMNSIFPILLTLMIGLGAGASANVFQPIVAIITTYVADFFKFIILPMFLISFVFNIISNLSDNVKLDKFNSFISSLFKWCVGFIFTVFFAIISIQGISAGSFDSLSIRTTKYTIKSYVPVMGGYLSDGMDLILSSSILIKNSVGLVGTLLIFSAIISPIIEIAVFSLMLKLVSAVMQPMGNAKMSNFLSSTSKSVSMLSTSVLAIGFMFVISVGLVMLSSNAII